jgi:hypothetical protein
MLQSVETPGTSAATYQALPLPDLDDEEDDLQTRYQPSRANNFNSHASYQNWSLHPFQSSTSTQSDLAIDDSRAVPSSRSIGVAAPTVRRTEGEVPHQAATVQSWPRASIVKPSASTNRQAEGVARMLAATKQSASCIQTCQGTPTSNHELAIQLLPDKDAETTGAIQYHAVSRSLHVPGESRAVSDDCLGPDHATLAAIKRRPAGTVQRTEINGRAHIYGRGAAYTANLQDLSFHSSGGRLASSPRVISRPKTATRPMPTNTQQTLWSSPKSREHRPPSQLSNISKRRATPHRSSQYHWQRTLSSPAVPRTPELRHSKSSVHWALMETWKHELSNDRRKQDKRLVKLGQAWQTTSEELSVSRAKVKAAEQTVEQLLREKEDLQLEVDDLLDQRRNRSERERALQDKSKELENALKESDEQRIKLAAEASAQIDQAIEDLKFTQEKQAAFEEFKVRIEASQSSLRNRVKIVVAEANQEISQCE